MRGSKIRRWLYILILMLILGGCGSAGPDTREIDIPSESVGAPAHETEHLSSEAAESSAELLTRETENGAETRETETAAEETSGDSGSASEPTSTRVPEDVEETNAPGIQATVTLTWGENSESRAASIPEYTGYMYEELNDGRPWFTEEELADARKAAARIRKYYTSGSGTPPGWVYSGLDRQGRSGYACAVVMRETFPTEERGPIGSIKPSGWHTVKYNDRIEGNYLYNRCHIIGYQMGGDNYLESNFLTGTRAMNVQGMLPFENRVTDFAERSTVLYRVTPVFLGKNRLAAGVILEAYSLDDDGRGLCFNVFCHNVQPGVLIDYTDGDSRADPDYQGIYLRETEAETGKSSGDRSAGNGEEKNQWGEDLYEKSSSSVTYVLNTNTKKFHLPSCSSVTDMKAKNREEFTGTREEAMSRGYEPCGRCHP